ncbi:hypothetical protein B0A49_04600 [Cryomyces minteri]|uniref:Thioesterase domain-containing protein n=1 Tax=Cryomyces minteri TaxID=331657 RepID=A0A4U0XLB1_9PEZI|nr:hypothetical protein B0A49_04600 [Cryomyces minteri]
MTSFAQATAVKAIDSHTYSAEFPTDWCIGSVPHGGFVTAAFLQVASAHFRTTLSKQKQPHTITLHLEFLRRTQEGPATFVVKDAKLGRRMSTIHVTLIQGKREEVVGYITNSDISTEEGVSFKTGYELHPAPYTAEVSKLRADKDTNWQEQKNMPFASFRKASQKVRFFFPRKGQLMQSLADEWLYFRNGEKFTNESLGYVSDVWPQLVESYRSGGDPYNAKRESSNQDAVTEGKKKGWAKFWYPTLLLNLDVKKALPAEGVDWLFVRVRAKQIRNGRLDLEVVILDETGDIVALSHHVSLVLGAERNMAQRKKQDEQGKSKL